MSHIAYIGLGSNLNQPTAQIKNALKSLNAMPGCELKKISSLYKTLPLGPPQPDYINACVELHTTLTAQRLLAQLQKIEQQQGRVREIHWGPRTIDLDILLYDSQIIKTPTLTIPHPELTTRPFVLVPLYEINPQLILPGNALLEDLVKQLGEEAHSVIKLNDKIKPAGC